MRAGCFKQVAQPVGPVVGEIEEERPVLVLLDEPDAVLGPEVGQVARLRAHRAVLDDLGVVEFGRVPVRHRDPVAEALLRRAGWRRGATCRSARRRSPRRCRILGNERELADRAIRVRPHLGVRLLATEVAVHAVLRRASGPVRKVARVGEQTGLLLKARVNRMPSAASRSMFGVRMSGLP